MRYFLRKPRPDAESRFTVLCIASLLTCFSPSKALGQMVAIFFILGMLFFVRVRFVQNLRRLTLTLTVFFCICGLYALIYEEFLWWNVILWLVTMSGFGVFMLDLRPVATERVLRKLALAILLLLVVESLYGLAQGLASYARSGSFDGGTGDLVRGTVEPGFTATPSGSNAMFAIMLSSLLTFVAVIPRLRPYVAHLVAIGVMTVTWLVASVMHTIVYLALAVILAIASHFLPPLLRGRISCRVSTTAFIVLPLLLLLLVVFGVLGPRFLPNNYGNILSYARRFVTISEGSESLKSIATYRTIVELPREAPLQPLIGLGPGQYTSRAALMLTGLYLRFPVPGLPQQTGVWTQRYIGDLLTAYNPGGSTYFPYYSWLTIYAELGVFSLIAALCFFARIAISLASGNLKPAYFGVAMSVLAFYVIFLGLQDNYWEFTQAVFPTFLLLALARAYIRNIRRLYRSTPQSPSEIRTGAVPSQ